jgi:hypothetical protein
MTEITASGSLFFRCFIAVSAVLGEERVAGEGDTPVEVSFLGEIDILPKYHRMRYLSIS